MLFNVFNLKDIVHYFQKLENVRCTELNIFYSMQQGLTIERFLEQEGFPYYLNAY